MILSFLFPSLAITSSLNDVKEEETQRPALLGLYFASSWCPDCTPISPKLKLLHEHHVKQLQKVEEQKEKEGEKGCSDDNDIVYPMDLIYISSDTTEEQYQSVLEVMNGSISKTSTDSDDDDDTDNDEDNSSPNSDTNNNKIWNYASLLPPTEQITKDEIATIKRYFGVCAMKEMGELQMEEFDRKFGIPTLIWIKMCPEQGDEVVSVDGVQELEELGVDGAWKKWQGLL